MESEKIISVCDAEITQWEKTKEDVKKIDTCPLCLSKMTDEHVKHVFEKADARLGEARDELEKVSKELEIIQKSRDRARGLIKESEIKVSDGEMELASQRSLKEKKEHLKKLVDEESALNAEIKTLEEKRKSLDARIPEISQIEEKCNAKIREIEEISSRTEKDADTAILYKERELESLRDVIKRGKSDLEEIDTEIGDITHLTEGKTKNLDEREERERKMNERFKKMFEERDLMQKKMQEESLNLPDIQGEIGGIEEQITYLKVGVARFDAEKQAWEMEMSEYGWLEIIQGSVNAIEERLNKAQDERVQIGPTNMRALEIYEGMKKDYDAVQVKVDTLSKEKNDILAIIEEIEKKKKREFMKTFREINTRFTQNFSKVYNKGVAYLELENEENIFEGGVGIVVKLAKGKYFDVTSLSQPGA